METQKKVILNNLEIKNIKELGYLNKTTDYQSLIGALKRPYQGLSDSRGENLMKILQKNKLNFFLDKKTGKIYTVGSASADDCSSGKLQYCLMPLIAPYKQKKMKTAKNGEIKRYHENGNIKTIENYKNYKLHGETKYYYENGKLEYIGNFLDGKIHGEDKRYYDNGKLHFIGNWKAGKRHGDWTFYDENGKLNFIEKWINDKSLGKNYH